ncbi:1-acylglycerol-3-phosphate O-acyltransferase PNPLA3 [Drosophila rhopaloa]|uniref:triacylglycerol lipase n=1 Tax=Drosophila rhopaloa TaxID=1041015 RepID=A0A6P4FE19_DRORH|nr:1-acylglycerol-3-phosphate O-acyltransferase PNPLA3 [Drosophila rhopaloa]
MTIRTRRSISFAGCGFLGIYYVGVAYCLRQHAPQLLLEKIAGSSAGALAACCLVCDLPLECMAGDFLRIVHQIRRHALGAFSPWFNLPECLLEGMHRSLPADAHRRASGRLHVSVTRVSDRRNVIISEFSSRQELLQALMCSCFIPGLSGLVPPQIRGVRYMDGAFSDNLPLLDEHTVTVSAFCGESDICPRDQNSHRLQLNIHWSNTSIRLSRRNLRRLMQIVVPGRPDFIANVSQQGYDDAMRFLRRNTLVKNGIKVQERGMISWIHQQEKKEKERGEMTKYLEKEQRDSKTIKKRDQKPRDQQNNKQQDQVNQVEKHRRNRKSKLLQKPKKNQKNKTKYEKCQKKEARNQEHGHGLKEKKNRSKLDGNQTGTQEKKRNSSLQEKPIHQDHSASSLMRSTWSLLRSVIIAPPLARHMVEMITLRLSQSLTLCEQPHFDLALMHTPSSCSSSSSSSCCPSSTPLGDSDNDKVKANRTCEANQVGAEDRVADQGERTGVH